ncbi:polysaccharide pyruvyl transferase family protein [Novosphingobium profundi]|uniref:polysaccharide pyruvyl transferase family protein n=1 Tax=Novosphingobium profundi TaxID=1774954 RepID=UPI001BDB5AD3|nr:polysaccharide pyruvyl transferase family protein [Novosphingobium profundi]MBT0667179.1 polysaccharide pyruvyl transferase family protein [Novosphingobium profundi]
MNWLREEFGRNFKAMTTALFRNMNLPAKADPIAAAPPPSLRLFNVKYSPNLGDGLLSECLEWALQEGGKAQARSIDLAARTAYSPGSPQRMASLRILQALPPPLRRQAIRLPLALTARRTWSPHYRNRLGNAQAIVIGGGNLLADMDLNFPTKIALAMKVAQARALPIFIYGVGASPGWSPRGRALLHEALSSGLVRGVWVRDRRSQAIWHELAGEAFGLEAGLVRDPGLLAAARYGLRKRPLRVDGQARLVGLNIMSALAASYHGGAPMREPKLDDWYLALARKLLDAGCQLEIFSNGSPEDRAAVKRIQPYLREDELAGRVVFPEISTPEDIARCCARLDGLVAYRMHAIIAAYSCSVPFLALAWDRKLTSFVESVGCADWHGDQAHMHPEDALARLFKAMEQGIDPKRHAATLDVARRDIEHLRQTITAELARNGA